MILQIQSKLDEAMALHKEQERICRELGNRNGIQASLGNQALILKAWGKLDEAMALHKEKECICREFGNPYNLAISLVNQSLILAEKMHQMHEALPLAEEAYQLAVNHGFTALAQQIKPILDSISSEAKKSKPPRGGRNKR